MPRVEANHCFYSDLQYVPIYFTKMKYKCQLRMTQMERELFPTFSIICM